MPWTSALDYKLAVMRYRHLSGFISLVRDRDSGRVFADPVTGQPCIDYTISAFDAANTLEGVIALAKICYITGATEIRAFLAGTEPFLRDGASVPTPAQVNDAAAAEMDLGVTDPAFEAWLASLRQAGNSPPHTAYISAHQMGTCRMSAAPDQGVVDDRGRVWGTKGLYVADASVFPSASGVNPMITNMAIADWIARELVREMGRE